MKYLNVALLIFLLNGCILGPDDSRINPYDPKSPVFGALFSEIKLSTSESAIELHWRNESNYSDGFLIEKKLNKFKVIDTLWSSTFFADSSGEYSLATKYRVTSFIQKGNGIDKRASRVTDEIDFGRVTGINVFPVQDYLTIRWNSSTHFDDVTIIEYKNRNSSEWQEIYKDEHNDRTEKSVNLNVPINGKYDFRIRLFLRNHKDKLEKFYEEEFTFG